MYCLYFLAVLFEEAVILGVASDALTFKYAATPSCFHTGMNLHDLPYCSLERTVSILIVFINIRQRTCKKEFSTFISTCKCNLIVPFTEYTHYFISVFMLNSMNNDRLR